MRGVKKTREDYLMRIGADTNQACDTVRNAAKNVVQMNTSVRQSLWMVFSAWKVFLLEVDLNILAAY